MVSTFYSVLYNGFKEFVPIRKSNIISRYTFCSCKIRKLINTMAYLTIYERN